MDKLIILGVVLVLGLLVAGVALYWLYERPVRQAAEIQYHNVSIRATDDDGKAIAANWTINTAGQVYTGQTLHDGFVLQQIPVNQTVDVIVSSAGYYTSITHPVFDVSVPTPVRIEPSLTPVGLVSISPVGRLGVDNPVPVILTAEGYVRAMRACVRWSTNLVSVSLEDEDARLVDKEPRIANTVDKCYDLNITLSDGEQATLYFKYVEYWQLTSKDSITLRILYGDYDLLTGEMRYSTADRRPFVREDSLASIGKS